MKTARKIADTDPSFKPTAKEIKRFWEKVDKTHPSGCWLWTRSAHPFGYGCVRMQGSTRHAHRVAWILRHGRLPAGMDVLIQCDNPRCVKHLKLGTAADIGRKQSKSRHWSVRLPERTLKGEDHPSVKLNEKKVLEIRELLKSDESQCSIAKAYRVSPRAISFIKDRTNWKHIP